MLIPPTEYVQDLNILNFLHPCQIATLNDQHYNRARELTHSLYNNKIVRLSFFVKKQVTHTTPAKKSVFLSRRSINTTCVYLLVVEFAQFDIMSLLGFIEIV